MRAGRGFGKTRSGAEWVRGEVEAARRGRLALVGATAADARDVMIEGPSGVLAVAPPWFRPKYEPSKRRVTWPNGAVASVFSADEPDRLRGPEHDGAWCDEVAAWRYREAWDNLQFGMRRGRDPRQVVTTTPRPTALVRELIADRTTAETRGTTYDNRVNLAEGFFDGIIRKYEGTRLGRQELLAELLDDNPYALWKREGMIERYRVRSAPTLRRVAVAVDPSGSSTGAECGIVAVGLGTDERGYVLEDASLQGSPAEWARVAVALYQRLGADRLVAESNFGGEMVEALVRGVDRSVSYRAVTASRGKVVRAEPVAALYEQGRVSHVGTFPRLEDELCEWVAGEASPNRLDALVWGVTELMIRGKELVVW